jgi:hypothetical protein
MQFKLETIIALMLPGIGQILGRRFSQGVDLLLILTFLIFLLLWGVEPFATISLFLLPLLWLYSTIDVARYVPLNAEQGMVYFRRFLTAVVGLGLAAELVIFFSVRGVETGQTNIAGPDISTTENPSLQDVVMETDDTEKVRQEDRRPLLTAVEAPKLAGLEQEVEALVSGPKSSTIEESSPLLELKSRTYTLVLGAFLSDQRAEVFRRKIMPVGTSKGKRVVIKSIQRKNLWYVVQIIGYQRREEAFVDLRRLKANYPTIKANRPYILSPSP